MSQSKPITMTPKPGNLLLLTAKRVHPGLQHLLDSALQNRKIQYSRAYYEDGEDDINAKLKGVSAVFCAPGRWLNTGTIQQNKHIRLYQLWSSGYDKFNSKACIDNQIKFNTNQGNNAQSVAEHTLLLMLASSKKLYEMHSRTIKGEWAGNCNGSDMYLLNGKTVFIVGLGNIGKKLMNFVLALGMKVIYYDKVRCLNSEILGAKYVEMDEGLAASDYITLHLHLNNETRHIINSDNIKLVKKNCFLINVSRAELVEQVVIDKIVNDDLIRGIALDVYPQEPTSGQENFLRYHNSIFTPHIAGSTREAITDCINYCADNLLKALSSNQFDSIN